MVTPKAEFFPDIVTDPNDEEVIIELIQFLKKRIQDRNLLQEELHQKQNNFRNILVELESENIYLKAENSSLKNYNDQQEKMISLLQARTCKLDDQIDILLYKLNRLNDALKNMQQELRNKDIQLEKHINDRQKILQKCNNKIQAITDRMTKKLEIKLHEQREQFENCIKRKDNKLKLVKQILVCKPENINDNAVSTTSINLGSKMETTKKSIPMISGKKLTKFPTNVQASSISTAVSGDTDIKTKSDAETTRGTDDSSGIEPSRLNKRDKIPVVNPRYGQTRSAHKWIDHRPAGMVPVGTILQPQTLSKRNISNLKNPKTFAAKSTRYCLFAQEQDTDGELETKLYKADVLPTSGGGAQIVFNDIECLKQISPTKIIQGIGQVNPQSTSVHS